MPAHKPERAPVTNEAEMILSIHDAQMSATNKSQELYYRMHKEMSPALIRIVNEALDDGKDREDTINRVQHVVDAYAQYIASSISALSLLLGGSDDARLEHRQAIAKISIELTNNFLKMFLEKERKHIMLQKGNRAQTP